jgi:hypothetical protein
MKSVLKCATKGLGDCKGSDQLRLLLPERDLPVDEDGRAEEKDGCAQMRDCMLRGDVAGQMAFFAATRHRDSPRPDIACDFRSHEELHELLRCHSVGDAPRKIEIAVACSGVMEYELDDLEDYWWETCEWLRCMAQEDGKGLAVRLRLMLGDEETRAVVEPWYEMLQGEWEEEKDGLELGTSGCELGTCVGREEYAEAWEKTGSVRNKYMGMAEAEFGGVI